MQLHTQAKAVSAPSFKAAPSSLLQHKCACGSSAGLDGECEECRKKQLQRRPANGAEVSTVPPMVHEVLRSPGQPLDPATRAFMEPRFGHDFGNVRIHADAKATESAGLLNAFAFTSGQDIVFGAGQYAPQTISGKKLLAHELTHVIQQRSVSRDVPQFADSKRAGSHEREADGVAEKILQEKNSDQVVRPTAQPPNLINCKSVDNATATPSAVPAPESSVKPADKITDQLKAKAKQDATKIKNILQENTFLGPGNQADIMAIVETWANNPTETGTRLAPFDYFIVALRAATFETGLVVKQYTSAFDQIFHRMSNDRVAQFKNWMQTQARILKDEKAIEMAKFEIDKELALESLQLSAEVTAAFASGGGSVLLQIIAWLATTLPGLYQKAKTIFDFVNTLRNIKLADIKQFFSPVGLGDLLVKTLFGEIQGLPAVEKEDEGESKEEKEPAAGKEEKGLIKVLHIVIKIFKVLKKVYGKVVAGVNKILAAINITTKSWFPSFSMIYAGIFKVMEVVSNPIAVLNDAVSKVREIISNFFKGIRAKVDEIAGVIKAQIEIIGKPAQLMKTLADKAVEMVLNFIITHPPSALVKVAFRAVEAGAGKSILELVREKIPIADKLINQIAESDTVKTLLKPLEPPIATVSGVTERIAGQAGGLINNVEGQALALVGSGTQMVSKIAGVDITQQQTAPAAKTETTSPEKMEGQEPIEAEAKGTTKPSGNFLDVVKQGVHTRLLMIGERNLVQKGKELGKAALEKGVEAGKGLAGKVKGLLLGPKVDFETLGVHHQLWVEEQKEEVFVFMASEDENEIEKRVVLYNKRLAKLEDQQTKEELTKLIEQLVTLNTHIKSTAKKEPKGLENDKQKVAQVIQQIEQLIPLIEFKTPNGAKIKVTREWSLLICDGSCKEIDSYKNHKEKVKGTGLDVHHLLEKRFLDPLNKLRKKRGINDQPTEDKDEINSVVLPGSKKSIENLVNSDPAAKGLEKSPYFHRWLSSGEQQFSISAELQNRVSGIGNQYSDAVAKETVTAGEVFDVHKEIYEVAGKQAWTDAIKIYFKGLLKF